MSSSEYTHYITGGIFVRPSVPAAVFTGTPFEFIDGRAPGDRDLCVVPRNHGDTYSVIESAQTDGMTSPDHVADELNDLLTLIGDGHVYTGDLTINPDGDQAPDETFRLRVVQHSAAGDRPAELRVVRDDAALIFPADYAVPAGPAVTFDADAARAWFADPAACKGYNVHPARPYTYDTLAGDWMARLLPCLSDLALVPHVWRTARGVAIEAVETLSPEGMVADGGIVLKITVGGLTLASEYLSQDTLAGVDLDLDLDGGTGKTQLAALAEALGTVAATANRLVEEHRTVRAADAHVSSPLAAIGPLTERVGADNIECALITLAELVAEGTGRHGVLRVDEHDILSDRQRMVASLVRDLHENQLAGDDGNA